MAGTDHLSHACLLFWGNHFCPCVTAAFCLSWGHFCWYILLKLSTNIFTLALERWRSAAKCHQAQSSGASINSSYHESWLHTTTRHYLSGEVWKRPRNFQSFPFCFCKGPHQASTKGAPAWGWVPAASRKEPLLLGPQVFCFSYPTRGSLRTCIIRQMCTQHQTSKILSTWPNNIESCTHWTAFDCANEANQPAAGRGGPEDFEPWAFGGPLPEGQTAREAQQKLETPDILQMGLE